MLMKTDNKQIFATMFRKKKCEKGTLSCANSSSQNKKKLESRSTSTYGGTVLGGEGCQIYKLQAEPARVRDSLLVKCFLTETCHSSCSESTTT